MASKVAILGKEVPLVIPLSYRTQTWKLLYKEVQNQRLAACSEKNTGSGLRVIDNLNEAVRNLKPRGKRGGVLPNLYLLRPRCRQYYHFILIMIARIMTSDK
jgi:hypothetical protein